MPKKNPLKNKCRAREYRRIRIRQRGTAVLYRVIKLRFSEKVIFERISKGRE
jgi:hypothetical protein